MMCFRVIDRNPVWMVLGLLGLVGLGCDAPGGGKTEGLDVREDERTPAQKQEHEAETQAWHDGRLDALRREDGWLTLVGLSWLEEGSNSVGSAEHSTVPLPASMPAKVATLNVTDGVVELRPVDGQTLEVDGRTVDASSPTALRSDAEASYSLVRLGTVSFYVIDRDGRLAVRVKDSASRVLADFKGIERFPVSWKWRKTADYTPRSEPKSVEIPTALGTDSRMASPGRIRFEHADEPYELDAFEAGSPDEVWFIFADASNGRTTYGGGRFVYAKFDRGGPSEAGPLVVDFNRAYNPPCVFTPYATCPLPTRENRLDVAVEAGEKAFAGGYH